MVVRDGQKHQILPAGEKASLEQDRARRSFQFVFTDWSIALQGDFASPEKWARINFTYNMTLSAVLALVLLAGIGLTIRTALRELHRIDRVTPGGNLDLRVAARAPVRADDANAFSVQPDDHIGISVGIDVTGGAHGAE